MFTADEHERDEGQRHAILIANIRDTLKSPHGYAVILHLLAEADVFKPYAHPTEYRLRDIFKEFYKDIEQADPSAALRLFAHCRGMSHN